MGITNTKSEPPNIKDHCAPSAEIFYLSLPGQCGSCMPPVAVVMHVYKLRAVPPWRIQLTGCCESGICVNDRDVVSIRVQICKEV